MEKSANGQIEFSIRDAANCEAAIAENISRGKWGLATINWGGVFGNLHYAALAACRIGDTRAPAFLSASIDTAHRAQEALFSHEKDGAIPSMFPFEIANVLTLLCVPRAALVTPFAMSYSMLGQASDRNLSFLLFERLTGRPPSDNWSNTISALGKNKRAKLAVDTYATFDRIILAAASGDEATAMMEASNASALFDKRATSAYYQGGPASAGGGPANGIVIDYELAAIQRSYFTRPAFGAEVHWWPW